MLLMLNRDNLPILHHRVTDATEIESHSCPIGRYRSGKNPSSSIRVEASPELPWAGRF